MLRHLYGCVVRLHPPAFRKRFADEMLSIYDQQSSRWHELQLLFDSFASLVRQRLFRHEFWHEVPVTDSPHPISIDGIPSFHTIGPFRPRSAALIHGLVLSTAVFCLTCFAIRYSWIRVLHVHIRELEFEGNPSPSGGNSNWFQPKGSSAALSPSPIPPISEFPQSVAARQEEVSQGPQRDQQPRQNQVEDASPSSAIGIRSSPSISSNGPLDAVERERVIDATISNLKAHYADPRVGQSIAEEIQRETKQGHYDAQTNAADFAVLLTSQIRRLSGDMHLEVVFSNDVLPVPVAESPANAARQLKALTEQNCAIEKVEILPHNVGYLKLNWFPPPSMCRATATNAMAALNGADAVIFDLRDNRGGDPEMVALIAAYLFDHPEYWYNPREATSQQSFTHSPVAGSRLTDKPVYLLTSATTISGAEQFSYNLKMLKRATLVGETTAGSAQCWSMASHR